jgi:ATP-dependent RNA helicase RhlE
MDSSSPRPARRGLALAILPESFGICRLHPRTRLPRWVFRPSSFYSVTRTRDELSIVAREDLIPQRFDCERDWRGIKVIGPLDFGLVGVVASLALPLARAGVSLFTVSSFDTDYLLVRAKNLDKAVAALETAGHQFYELPEAEGGPEEPEEEAEEDDSRPSPEVAAEPAPIEPPDITPPDITLPNITLPTITPPQVPSPFTMPEIMPPDIMPPDIAPPNSEPILEPPHRPFHQPEAPPLRGEVFSEPHVVPFSLGIFGADDAADSSEAEVAEISVPAMETDPFAAGSPEETLPEAIADDLIQPVEAEKAEKLAEPAEPPAEGRLPADELEAPDDSISEDEIDATGMFTGAIPQHEVETTEDAFESLGISSAILDTVRSIGFVHPTPIQAAVIPLALEGGDIIGLAETGSGKTAAFCLPLAERLTHGKGLRGLILCPTREIALQTKAFLDIFGRDHQLRTALIIGGVKMGPQFDALRREPDIIVATPGRLCDHLRRGTVRLNKLEELVLDEADHMLDLGFLPQIQEVLEAVPSSRRTMMFSATMPPPIERLANRFMHDPYMIDLRPVGSVAAGIEHRLYLVREDDKKRCLVELLKQVPGSTLIFTRRKLHAEYLARQLQSTGLPVDRIHSDRTQAQRVQALRGFREDRFRILVATDVAARGIDVPRLQHVINFGAPEGVEDYIHRAGRTARGSAIGIVSTIGTWLDKPMIQEIEKKLGVSIPRHEAPGVDAYQEIKRRPEIRRRRLL